MREYDVNRKSSLQWSKSVLACGGALVFQGRGRKAEEEREDEDEEEDGWSRG